MIYDIYGNRIGSTNSEGKLSTNVIIAASNSSDADKAIADYVCDGVNDEIELQSAVDSLLNGGTVYLAFGDYYIDGFNILGDYKVAIALKGNDKQREVRIVGPTSPIRKSTGLAVDGSSLVVESAVIHVTNDALASITGNEDRVSLFGVDTTSRTFMVHNMMFKDFGIELANNQKKIICIDGEYLSMMQIENMLITSAVKSTVGVEECVGIRGLEGANFGYGYRISNTKVVGLGTGYDLPGEHLIIEQSNARHCNYSFRFQNNVKQNSTHDTTVINCCCELCVHFPTFSTGTFKHPYHLINFNAEIAGDESDTYATKYMATGNGYGIIEYSIGKTQNWLNQQLAFFESGHGYGFKCINMIDPTIGVEDNTPPSPNYGQQYFDTTNNSLKVYNGSEWITV